MPETTVEILNRVRKIVLETPFAVLATVGEDSRPFARWMSPIFAAGDIKEFHVLAAPNSRKMAQLRKNPNVTWIFSSPLFEEVVTLHGTASIEDDQILRAEIWERMPYKQRAFMLKSDENLQFAILRTSVHTVEFLRPKLGETVPVVLKL